ncbi:MAG: apolipoprotein N-acyltransferase, partial [Nocardioidaceae bacterium]|nr:apolipoprotein N-acyltransferase [Nocardioidaceae bacterium]
MRTRSWRPSSGGLARTVVAALAGVATALGFEPTHVWVLVPLAACALTLVCLDRTARSGFWLGAVYGTAFMLVLLPWVQVIGAYAWLPLAVAEGLFYGFAGLATTVVRRLPGWPLWAACSWVAVEAGRSLFPFGGFPWGRLAFATEDTPVANAFAYVGAPGTTFLVALLGVTLAWGIVGVAHRPVRSVVGVAVAVGLVCAPAFLAFPQATPGQERPHARVAAVQGNVPGTGLEAFAERRAVLDNHGEATLALGRRVAARQTPRPDLVVWPENSSD